MNILIFAAREFNPVMGGIERVSTLLAEFLVSHGHKVYFLSGLKTNGPEYKLKTKQFFLPNGFKGNTENRKFVKGLIKELNINIIINQTDFFSLFSRSYIHKSVKIISVIHNSYKAMNMAKPNIYRKLRYRIAITYFLSKVGYNSDIIVLFSNKFIKEFKIYCKVPVKNKIKIIPNFNTYINPIINKNKEKIVLYVGRLYNEHKRIDRLLHIWKNLDKIKDDWRLIIVGDGPDKKMLEALSIKYNLKNVTFPGADSPEKYYSKASIFCLTSSYESFGMVITEAMQHAVVPIVFNSYATASEIINDKVDGFLIPPFDMDIYSEKLNLLMSENNLRNNMAAEAANSVKKFSLNNIGKEWIKLLNSI